jgi:hypothetical protein
MSGKFLRLAQMQGAGAHRRPVSTIAVSTIAATVAMTVIATE